MHGRNRTSERPNGLNDSTDARGQVGWADVMNELDFERAPEDGRKSPVSARDRDGRASRDAVLRLRTDYVRFALQKGLAEFEVTPKSLAEGPHGRREESIDRAL